MLTRIQEPSVFYICTRSSATGEVLLDLPEGKVFSGYVQSTDTAAGTFNLFGKILAAPLISYPLMTLKFAGPALLVTSSANGIFINGEIT